MQNDFVFDQLLKYGHTYNLIAYLSFIRDDNHFLPISQKRFDKIFEELGIPDFKIWGNASFENYSTFNNIVKQVRNFLKTKDKSSSLLYAHSFLWIIGNQMKNENDNQETTLQAEQKIAIETELKQIIAEENDELAFPEGKENFRLHKSKERNRELIKAVKERRLLTDQKLCCDVCSFSFTDKYGDIGEGYIEAHHLFPISELKEETVINMDDIALVCSNCHRMLHRRRPWLNLDNLKTMLQ